MSERNLPLLGASVVLGTAHLVVLALVLVGTPTLVLAARRDPSRRWVLVFRRSLSLLLLANQVVWIAERVLTGRWGPAEGLPCHLCDAALFACAAALWNPRPWSFELGYFWGLGGTLQGLFTPTVEEDFPDYEFCRFFIMHAGIVVGATFLAAGLRWTPRRGAVCRVFVATNAFALVAALTNHFSGGNYMFLAAAPGNGSLLDHLGPWPFYILGGEVVALALFLLLTVPFSRRERTFPFGLEADRPET